MINTLASVPAKIEFPVYTVTVCDPKNATKIRCTIFSSCKIPNLIFVSRYVPLFLQIDFDLHQLDNEKSLSGKTVVTVVLEKTLRQWVNVWYSYEHPGRRTSSERLMYVQFTSYVQGEVRVKSFNTTQLLGFSNCS